MLSWRYVCCFKLILHFYFAFKTSRYVIFTQIYCCIWLTFHHSFPTIVPPSSSHSTLLLNKPVLFLFYMYCNWNCITVLWMCNCMYGCNCIYGCMNTCIYVCVCMHACMYECIHACMGWCASRFCIGEVLHDIFLSESQYFT